MADYDSNLIKPVDSLKNISGMTPVRHREERKHRQHMHHEDSEKDETMQDETVLSEETAPRENDINPDGTGIDYCA
jgi:hypothetical protein